MRTASSLAYLALYATLAALPVRALAAEAGTWSGQLHPEARRLYVSLQLHETSQWGQTVDYGELQGFTGQDGEARFSLPREAGTLAFEGTFKGGLGAGHFQFTPAAGYAEQMARLGYPEAGGEKALHMALADVGPRRVRALQEVGFKNLPWDDLEAFCVHGVTPAYVKEMRALGLGELDADDLTTMRIHGVTPAFVREMRAAGYTRATKDDLVKLRIHGVDKLLLERKGKGAQREGKKAPGGGPL